MLRRVYRHSALIISCFLIASVAVVIYGFGYREWGVIVPAAGALLSLSYFLQKQWLDEAHLCKELFMRYSERYDKMNDRLVSLRESALAGRAFTEEERRLLLDYFNMCGEEYFFYAEGHIYKSIWQTWLLGMREYYEVPAIRQFWREELQKNSYYGLTFEVMKKSPQFKSLNECIELRPRVRAS